MGLLSLPMKDWVVKYNSLNDIKKGFIILFWTNGLLHLQSIHPLWKILEKCTSEGVRILNAPTFSVIFRSGLSQGSKYLIWKCQMSLFIWNSYSPFGKCFLNLPQTVWNWNGVAHKCEDCEIVISLNEIMSCLFVLNQHHWCIMLIVFCNVVCINNIAFF